MLRGAAIGSQMTVVLVAVGIGFLIGWPLALALLSIGTAATLLFSALFHFIHIS